MRISDCSSDVCSSDLRADLVQISDLVLVKCGIVLRNQMNQIRSPPACSGSACNILYGAGHRKVAARKAVRAVREPSMQGAQAACFRRARWTCTFTAWTDRRSEEHTSDSSH